MKNSDYYDMAEWKGVENLIDLGALDKKFRQLQEREKKFF